MSIRELAEKWLGFDEDAAYMRGLKTGVQETSDLLQDRVERKAINLFSEKGYPNPLHIFDISISGIPYLNQEPISKPKAIQLKQEAGLLKSMLIWDVIQDSVKQEAIKKATFYSKNWEETLAGKMMLTNLGIIKKIVETIQSMEVDKLPESSTESSKML